MIQTGFHKLIPAHGIPERLTHDIAHAETSVYLQTMAFSPEGEPMGRICASLMEAARRGVAATLAFDEISLKTKEIGDRAETLGFCDSFREAGGTVRVLGGTGLFMTLMNRSHGKIYMADDVHYYGGGVNLTSDSFMHHDYMLRTEVPVARQALVRAAELSLPGVEEHDATVSIDPERTLLIDAGTQGSSVILEHAIDLARRAMGGVWYMSQYSPAPRLARALRSRVPPDRIHASFNRPRNASNLHHRLESLVDNRISAIANNYSGMPRVHGKALVVRTSDGTFEAITGSHNFCQWGVTLGTKEVALHTTNQDDCAQLVEFMEHM